MKKFSDEMIIEMLKAVDDPAYAIQVVEPTDAELNAMIPAMLKEVLIARRVIKASRDFCTGKIAMGDLEKSLLVYEATVDWNKFMNGENI